MLGKYYTINSFPMARYGLFVLKVPLNPNQPTYTINSTADRWKPKVVLQTVTEDKSNTSHKLQGTHTSI